MSDVLTQITDRNNLGGITLATANLARAEQWPRFVGEIWAQASGGDPLSNPTIVALEAPRLRMLAASLYELANAVDRLNAKTEKP